MEVFGNYGVLDVCPDTGKVRSYKPDPDDEPAYADITRFDVEELRRYYGPDQVREGAAFDIILVGFWYGAASDYCEGEDVVRCLAADLNPDFCLSVEDVVLAAFAGVPVHQLRMDRLKDSRP